MSGLVSTKLMKENKYKQWMSTVILYKLQVKKDMISFDLWAFDYDFEIFCCF